MRLAALAAALLFAACGAEDGSATGPSGGADGGEETSGSSPGGPSGGGGTGSGTGGDGSPDDPRTVTIEMYRISYVAPTATDIVTIKLGESVRWVNRDGTRHTATSDSVPVGGKGFNTGWLERGDEYVFRPNVTGTWVYSCLQYPNRMGEGRIRVIP